MRWSIGLRSSPRQYAPATLSSLNAGMFPVDGTCGPAHRSSNSPCVNVEIGSPSGISDMISIFSGSPELRSFISPLEYSLYRKEWSSEMTFRIRASISSRTSGVNGLSTRKS